MQRIWLVITLVAAASACGELDDSFEPGQDDSSTEVEVGAVPELEYCDTTREWNSGWSEFEAEVIRQVNLRRADGGVCTGNGRREEFGPSGALRSHPALRCSARNHSLDMGTRGFFAHDSLNGVSSRDRIETAGYRWSRIGENIAVGQSGPAQVMEAWMSSFSHCQNILEPGFSEIGVGFFSSGSAHPENAQIPGRYWTQNFAAPR